MKNLLHYEVSGSGEAVVLLHGFMEDSLIWTGMLPAFAHKQLIVIDLHGHGNSFFDAGIRPSIPAMAEQVREVVRELGLSHYQVVGHSLGGYVACELLQADPAIEHITLMHSHPWADSETKKKDRDRVIALVKTKKNQFIGEAVPNLFPFPEEHLETIERYKRIAEKMSPEAISWSTAAMRDRLPYTGTLIAKPQAVSFIQGQLDPLIPNIKLHDFAQEHGIGFYEIPRCGHMGHEEAPEQMKALLAAIVG